MKKEIKYVYMIMTQVVLLALAGCDLIDYHPYDGRVDGAYGINARNISRITERCACRKTIRFVQISDTQRWYDETEAAVKSINSRGDIDFVIHCGDVSDFGATREFSLQRDILERLNVPYVVVIGNHDCLGTGKDVYRHIFGDTNFSFDAGNTHFVCLNTNATEYDYSTPVPDLTYIREDYGSVGDAIERTVVAMHAMPTSEQFNNNVAKAFEYEIRHYPGLAFCICGHGHKTMSVDIFDDGVMYHEVGAGKSREYIIYTLNADGTYEQELVKY